MNLLPSNQELWFEVTFDANDLEVAMSVYKLGGAPILVSGPIAMDNAPGTNTYVGGYTPQPGVSYLVVKAVYTDGTFTTLDPDHSTGSETFTTTVSAGSPSDTLVGEVNDCDEVLGIAEDDDEELIGEVTC